LGSKLISVLFQPTALHLLTGIEMSKLYRKHTLLRNYLGISACELSIDLKKIDKSKDQLPFIEAFISRLVAERKPAFGIVEEIAQIIRAHDGLVQISELAEKYNISSKHLENTFKSQVGITPGKYAKVIRFWRVYQSLLANLSFSEGIEEAFGYYDKSHFRKDFKLFTGFTPEEIIDEQKKKMEHYVKELKLK